MSSFERLKGKLQRRLSDDSFYDDNFAEIEQLCKKYLENETTEDPQYARTETGIYLLYHLIGELGALWDAEQPFLQDRRDALRNRRCMARAPGSASTGATTAASRSP